MSAKPGEGSSRNIERLSWLYLLTLLKLEVCVCVCVCVCVSVCVCGTLDGTPNDGWQACSGNLVSLKTAIISLFTHQPNLASSISEMTSSFLRPRSLSFITLVRSLLFYFIPHYFFTSPLSIINAVLKSFKVNLSSSSLEVNCLEVINSIHLVLSWLKQDSSDNNIWPRCGVCLMSRCEWMWKGQRRLCGGVCEHQRLQALWLWAGPRAGRWWTQLQR